MDFPTRIRNVDIVSGKDHSSRRNGLPPRCKEPPAPAAGRQRQHRKWNVAQATRWLLRMIEGGLIT